MAKDTKSIKSNLVPLVDFALATKKNKKAYNSFVNDFFSKRDTDLYDNLPCSRIVCSEEEMDKLFVCLDISKKDVAQYISETYYGQMENFNPRAAKHEFTVTQLCVIRNYVLSNSQKEAELAMLVLAFSGKFYPSRHYNQWRTVLPARHIMEYVVNNKLSQKYDLAAQGSVLGAVRSIGRTWLSTYKSKFKTFNDEDVVYLVQQLHSRIGSFMKNIAEAFYKANEEKDVFMAYSSDSFEQDNYHIADNDTLKVERITEAVLARINSTGVEYKLTKACSDENITPTEARAVIESIVDNKDNIPTMKELISLMVTTYFATSKDKDVTNISFITYSVAPKPNAKQKEIIRQKQIVEDWLCESGTAYMRRRSRIATKNSYERAVRMYFALLVHNTIRRA